MVHVDVVAAMWPNKGAEGGPKSKRRRGGGGVSVSAPWAGGVEALGALTVLAPSDRNVWLVLFFFFSFLNPPTEE